MRKEEFVRRVRGCERRLYRVAYTLLRNDADCEDAVQEALLKAWAKIAFLREEAYFETWLIRILMNEAKLLMRKHRAKEVELTENIPQPASDESYLQYAMLKLPEKQRIALELHHIEGYSVREIAVMLRVPEGTVKWRLKKAREQLKTVIEKEGLL